MKGRSYKCVLVKLKFTSFQLMSFVATLDGLDENDVFRKFNRRKVPKSHDNP